MAPQSPQLPPKPEVALALLQSANSLFIHLDPRPETVFVPSGFKKQPQLVLQVGLNMTVSIPDLDVGEDGISCTLSFNRRPEYCKIPWDAIYGLVGEDGKGMIWPESVPAEVAASAQGRASQASTPKKSRRKLHIAGTQTPPEENPSSTESTQSAEALPAPNEAPVLDEAEGAVVPQEAEAPSKETPSKTASTKASKERKFPSYLRVVK